MKSGEIVFLLKKEMLAANVSFKTRSSLNPDILFGALFFQ